jgi:hypothetical protein
MLEVTNEYNSDGKYSDYVTLCYCTLRPLVSKTLVSAPHSVLADESYFGKRLVVMNQRTTSPCALTHLLRPLYLFSSPQARNSFSFLFLGTRATLPSPPPPLHISYEHETLLRCLSGIWNIDPRVFFFILWKCWHCYMTTLWSKISFYYS